MTYFLFCQEVERCTVAMILTSCREECEALFTSYSQNIYEPRSSNLWGDGGWKSINDNFENIGFNTKYHIVNKPIDLSVYNRMIAQSHVKRQNAGTKQHVEAWAGSEIFMRNRRQLETGTEVGGRTLKRVKGRQSDTRLVSRGKE